MAGAREVLAAIARAMQGVGGAAPADAAIAAQLGTPTQYPSAMDARRALQSSGAPRGAPGTFPIPPGGTQGSLNTVHGVPVRGALQGPAMMQGPATMSGPRPAFRPDMRMGFPESGRYNTGGVQGGVSPRGPMQGPPGMRPVGPVALPGQPNPATFPLGTSRATGSGVPVNPRHLPVPFDKLRLADLNRDITNPFPGGTERMYGPPKPGSAGAARAVAGQAAGGEVRAATAAMNRPLHGPAMMQGPATMSGAGGTPPGPRGSAPYSGGKPPVGGTTNVHGGYDPRTGQRLPAVFDKTGGFGKTSFGGVSGWAKSGGGIAGTHNPFEIARNYNKQIKATAAAGGPGKLAGGATYGKLGAAMASKGWGPGTMAFFRAANPAIMTAMVGNLMLGAAGFEEGTKGDIIGEGLMVGAAFGAPWGGVGALIGAPAFMALNVITGGAAANLVQALPLVGGVFGGTETKVDDARDIAKTMFGNAATAQGLDPETAELMSSTFEAYWKMAEAGMIDPSQLLPMIYQTGRQHGLTGYPWEPETMNPAYSAEDIAGITEGVGKSLQPLQDVATSMMNMDYSHIQDESIRARLIESSNRVAENMVNGMGAAVQGPATTAMLSEAQANTQLGGQLGAGDPFESMLLGAG